MTSPLMLGATPPVTDGQHRLWSAGSARNYPLPVLSEELSNAVWQFELDPMYGTPDYVGPLRQLDSLTSWWRKIGSKKWGSLNVDHLVAIEDAKAWLREMQRSI